MADRIKGRKPAADGTRKAVGATRIDPGEEVGGDKADEDERALSQDEIDNLFGYKKVPRPK